MHRNSVLPGIYSQSTNISIIDNDKEGNNILQNYWNKTKYILNNYVTKLKNINYEKDEEKEKYKYDEINCSDICKTENYIRELEQRKSIIEHEHDTIFKNAQYNWNHSQNKNMILLQNKQTEDIKEEEEEDIELEYGDNLEKKVNLIDNNKNINDETLNYFDIDNDENDENKYQNSNIDDSDQSVSTAILESNGSKRSSISRSSSKKASSVHSLPCISSPAKPGYFCLRKQNFFIFFALKKPWRL